MGCAFLKFALSCVTPFGEHQVSQATAFRVTRGSRHRSWPFSSTRSKAHEHGLLCRFRDLQCGRDLVSGTVNVTVWLHVAHPGKT